MNRIGNSFEEHIQNLGNIMETSLGTYDNRLGINWEHDGNTRTLKSIFTMPLNGIKTQTL
jgi:hypothetical protein